MNVDCVNKIIQSLIKGKDCNKISFPSHLDDPFLINVVLYTAIKYKRYQVVDTILSNHYMDILDYIKPEASSVTPLFIYAIEKDRPEAIRSFIKHGANNKPIQDIITKKYNSLSESILTTPRLQVEKSINRTVIKHNDSVDFDDESDQTNDASMKITLPQNTEIKWNNGTRTSLRNVQKTYWRGLPIIEDKPIQSKNHNINKGIDGIDLIRRRRRRFNLIMKHPDFISIRMLCISINNGVLEAERRRAEDIAITANKYFSITGNITQRVSNKKKWKVSIQRFCDGNDVDENRVLNVIVDCATLLCFPCNNINGIKDKSSYLQDYYSKYGITWNETLTKFDTIKNQTEYAISHYCTYLSDALKKLNEKEIDLVDVENKLANAIKNENMFFLELETIIKTTDILAQDVSTICELLLSGKFAEYYILRYLRKLRRSLISSPERSSLGSEVSEVEMELSKVKNVFSQIVGLQPKPQKATIGDIEKCSQILHKISLAKWKCLNIAKVHFPEILQKIKLDEKFSSFNICVLTKTTSDNLGLTKYEVQNGNLFLYNSSLKCICDSLYPLRLWNNYSIPHPCLYVNNDQVYEFIPFDYIPILQYCNFVKQSSGDLSFILHQLLLLLLTLQEHGFVHGLICLESLYVCNNKIILLHSGVSLSYDYSKTPISLQNIIGDKASIQNDQLAGIWVFQYLSKNYSMCIKNAKDIIDACQSLIENKINIRVILPLLGKKEGLVVIAESIKNVKKKIWNIQQHVKEVVSKNIGKSVDIIKKVYIDKSEKEKWEDIEDVMNEQLPIKEGDIESLWDTRDDLVNDAKQFVEFTQPPYWELQIFHSNELFVYTKNLSLFSSFQTLFDELTSFGKFKVLGVTQLENSRLWLQYAATRALTMHSNSKYEMVKTKTQQTEIGKQISTEGVNEVYLFQGIQSKQIPTINVHGLTEEEFTEGTCGYGLYFTDDLLMEHHNNCEENEDSLTIHCMLLVRVVLGKCVNASKVSVFSLEDDSDSMYEEIQERTVEYAIYEPRYSYPEYIITYQYEE